MKTASSSPRTAGDVLQAGYWFSRNDALFEITVWDPEKPLQVEARSAKDSSLQIFTLMELFAPQPPTRFAATRQELVSATTTNQIGAP